MMVHSLIKKPKVDLWYPKRGATVAIIFFFSFLSIAGRRPDPDLCPSVSPIKMRRKKNDGEGVWQQE